MPEYPWIPIARNELGVHEIPGPESEQRILEYIASTTYPNPYEQDDSEVPWCSCFVNWCIKQAGLKGTDSAWARSWLNWGREPSEEEYDGCVCVLDRGANSGHVGFLVGWDENTVTLLGGNQGDKVCQATFNRDRVLGYRIMG